MLQPCDASLATSTMMSSFILVRLLRNLRKEFRFREPPHSLRMPLSLFVWHNVKVVLPHNLRDDLTQL